MNFTEILCVMFLVLLLGSSVSKEIQLCTRFNENLLVMNKKIDSQEFISESFKNTCNGKGFSSLNQWQITCRSMFQLDYIGWSDASDFLDVDYSNSGKTLYYGKWNGNLCSGEIYCRKK